MSNKEIIQNHCCAILSTVADAQLSDPPGTKMTYVRIAELAGVPESTVRKLINEHARDGEFSRLSLSASTFGFVFRIHKKGRIKLSVVRFSK